jgi:hypothetical protein
MQIDPLNDALIKMYNAEQAGKFNVELTPASKLLGNVLEIMQIRLCRKYRENRRWSWWQLHCRVARSNQQMWHS